MTQEAWLEIKQRIKDTFEVSDEYTEDLEPGTADSIEFTAPQGVVRASFITKPKLLDKKTHYSNRIGGGVRVEYDFSDHEFVSHLEVHTWDADKDEWKPVEGSLF